ncbi:hypothetical protein [Rhodobacter ferrooxidans]|uniref:hypothetical protein n=1 Tax=Rhodobacter ferrooxidans TaxID=371731 RepID=UPI0012EA118F|nr:hypothetical protein [Rhodobacter sp. SW2]
MAAHIGLRAFDPHGIADQGTGTFGNHALYIGRRGGTSLPFNGRLYGLALRGASSTTSEIVKTERYLARKSGVAA